jgi:hypothetical protein
MKVFIEEQKYPLEAVEGFLDNRYYDADLQGNVKIPYVGYFYCAVAQTTVIILPKVFAGRENDLDETFLFSVSTWLYLAIKQFNTRKKDNQISEVSQVQEVISNLQQQQNSELEVILSLLKFNRDNQSLFTFVKKNNSSQNRKTNWTKTVSKQQPILNNLAQPIYIQPITKSKILQTDEELICIFFSLLYDLQAKYHFKTFINPAYELMKGRAYEQFKSKATRRLKAIKNNYFSDKLLRLWHLCYAYFERLEQVKANKAMNEILLVRDFNIVFEDMVDALLGESQLPKSLKEHKDGKRIDHIYPYQSLIFDDDIYYIGDSKYYKNDSEFSQNSVYKQYTYSKNVIQYNIDLFNKNELAENFRYRDDLTEGYNVTPNFFISAILNEKFDASLDSLTAHGKPIERNIHFENRLFDRDTLHLQAYDINFLFVLNSYIARNHKQSIDFSRKAKILFRQNLLNYLNESYKFYEVKPNEPLEDFVNQHFKALNGKMYRASANQDTLIIALEKAHQLEDFVSESSIGSPFFLT